MLRRKKLIIQTVSFSRCLFLPVRIIPLLPRCQFRSSASRWSVVKRSSRYGGDPISRSTSASVVVIRMTKERLRLLQLTTAALIRRLSSLADCAVYATYNERNFYYRFTSNTHRRMLSDGHASWANLEINDVRAGASVRVKGNETDGVN